MHAYVILNVIIHFFMFSLASMHAYLLLCYIEILVFVCVCVCVCVCVSVTSSMLCILSAYLYAVCMHEIELSVTIVCV